MELSPFPAASILLVSVAALSFSMPVAAYGQAAQTPDPTNAGKAVFSKATNGTAMAAAATEVTRCRCARPS